MFYLFSMMFSALWYFILTVLNLFWIWMIVDCFKQDPARENVKLLWLLAVILGWWPGALLYYYVRRKPRVTREQMQLAEPVEYRQIR